MNYKLILKYIYRKLCSNDLSKFRTLSFQTVIRMVLWWMGRTVRTKTSAPPIRAQANSAASTRPALFYAWRRTTVPTAPRMLTVMATNVPAQRVSLEMDLRANRKIMLKIVINSAIFNWIGELISVFPLLNFRESSQAIHVQSSNATRN